jgi:hypothetical protein
LPILCVGFLKSRSGGEPDDVGAFRIKRTAGRLIEVAWKPNAILGMPWHGIKGPDSPGFIVLRSRPLGIPRLIQARTEPSKKRRKAQRHGVCGAAIRKLCEMHEAPEAPSWNERILTTGELPLGRPLERYESYSGQLFEFGLIGSLSAIRYVCVNY